MLYIDLQIIYCTCIECFYKVAYSVEATSWIDGAAQFDGRASPESQIECALEALLLLFPPHPEILSTTDMSGCRAILPKDVIALVHKVYNRCKPETRSTSSSSPAPTMIELDDRYSRNQSNADERGLDTLFEASQQEFPASQVWPDDDDDEDELAPPPPVEIPAAETLRYFTNLLTFI